MELLRKAKKWWKGVVSTAPVMDLADAMLPRTPSYCTPTHYEVTLDKGWIVTHNGLNRKERRRLEALLRQTRPVELFLRSGRNPIAMPVSKKLVKRRLRSTPSNTPVRAVYLDGKKTYVGEPEFLEFMNRPEVLATIAETYTPRADHVIPLQPEPAYV